MKRSTSILCFIMLALISAAPLLSAANCKVKISTNPQGAMFTVNIAILKFGPTPMNFEFEQGKPFRLTFYKDGYVPKTIDYQCNGGDISVDLVKEGAPIVHNEKERICMFQITSDIPNADVFINNELRGRTPYSMKIDYGTYAVRVSKKGYGEYSENIRIDRPTLTIRANLERHENSNISIQSNVKGADVFVDDVLKGQTPLDISLDYGTYKIRVSFEGFGDYTDTINVNKKDIAIVANLSRQKQNLSMVQVTSNARNAKVYFNDEYKGDTPLSLKVGYGTYRVRVEARGHDDFEESYTINTSNFKIDADFDRRERDRGTQVQILSNVKNADVYLDDKLVGNVPLTIKIDFGKHDLLVSQEGFEDYTDTIDVKGRDMTIQANLSRASRVSLSVISNIDGADVFLNDRKIGKTPLTIQQSTGRYRLRVALPGFDDFTTDVRLQKENTTVEAILSSEDMIVVELPVRCKVRVDDTWYVVNWDPIEKNKQGSVVVNLYAPRDRRKQNHNVYIEYNGLSLSKNMKFYGKNEKSPVLKLGLSLE
jgi:hypothetical protein